MNTHVHKSEVPAKTEGRMIRWASFYDGFANIVTLGHIRRLRTLTIDQAQLKPGEKVLDVGCGTGGVTIPAKQRVGKTGKAAGIDPSPEMIAVASKKARRAGLEVDFRIGAIESLPYPDAAFDVVTSSLMMHHLPEHLQVQGLAEIKRVLKPGGRLLIADMTRASNSMHAGVFTLLTFQHGHGSEFGIEDLPKLIEAAGFEKIKQSDERFLTIGFVHAVKPAV
jgi:demethylmenaquinone methyltransferase/2-methoxy-6-polyprenyl-1,4-benzoquinol methylase/phosphoethanolamine N-methyltransferase